MPTHPLWRPYELADLDEVAKLQVGSQPPRTITVVPYDPAWPDHYAELESRVRAALGSKVLSLQHIGSTSVPGLAAKPVIDADLVVGDSADEASYVPALEAAGFVLRIREPDWEGHRLLTLEAPTANLHVFPPGTPEAARHRMFRDWLLAHPDDREVYAALKTGLGTKTFRSGMDYNNQKAALVYDIYERIFAADPAHEHDPQPRP